MARWVVLVAMLAACPREPQPRASELHGGIDAPIKVDGTEISANEISTAMVRSQRYDVCSYQVMGQGPRIAYVWALCSSNGGTSAESLPVALDITGARVTGVRVPRDGSDSVVDIKRMFPPDVRAQINAEIPAYNDRVAKLEAAIAAKSR